MADEPKRGRGARGPDGVSLWSSDFEANISFTKAQREVKEFEQSLDRVTEKMQRLGQIPVSAGSVPRVPVPGLPSAALPSGVLPQYQRSGVNPMPMVFSEHQVSGGQANRRRDPVPMVSDTITRDLDGTPRALALAPRRLRNPIPYVAPERFESVYQQGEARQPVTAPYFTPQSPTARLSRREQVLQSRAFGRTDLYGGNAQRAADRTYTELRGSGIAGALDGDVLDDVPRMRANVDPTQRPNFYPTERMTRRQRAILLMQQGREHPYRNVQSAMDREYTVLGGDGGVRGALPLPSEVTGAASNLYSPDSPFVPTSSSWRASRAARAAYAAQGPLRSLHRGLSGIETLGGAGARSLSAERLLSAASGVYLAQEIGQGVSALSDATIGQSVRIDEYRELLANSLLGNGLGRQGADRLAERLIGTRYIPGMGLSTSELGMSQGALAEQYKGLAPIVRVGSKGTEDFVQRLQRGAVLSQLLLARDPSQGQAGVNVALSELLAGGSTRFLSLSRRFELSNQQLRRIETAQGGEGVADPVAVAIKALEQMGLGPGYLQARADNTFAGEMSQSRALIANLRADVFERGTSVLGSRLGQVNDAFETYQTTSAYTRGLEATEGGVGRMFDVVTKPIVNALAGNMLRGGRLDEGYLTRSASEMMQTRGGRFVDNEGEIVSAGKAFREAAKVIQGAHLERLASQPGYDPAQKMLTDTLLSSGLMLGGGVLLNRLFGGAGGLLLKGAMTPGTGLGAALGAAGAAAAPTAAVMGGALAISGGIAAYRRSTTSADMARTLERDNPELLVGVRNPLAYEDLQDLKNPLNRLTPSSLITPALESLYNSVTGGEWGRERYGTTGATRDTFIADTAQRANVENALRDAGATLWRPGMTRQQGRAQLRGLAFDLKKQAQANPDSPLAEYFGQDGALDTALRAADASFAEAPQRSTRALLMTALETAYRYSRPFGMIDPETGQRVNLKRGFTMEQAQQFVDTLTTDAPKIEGGVNYAKLYRDVETRAEKLAQGQQNGAASSEPNSISPYRRLNLSQLPSVFDDIDPNPDPRELIPSTVRRSALGERDPRRISARNRGLRSGIVQRPLKLASLPLIGLSEGQGEAQRLQLARASREATERFYGGIVTADDAEHRARGTAGEGGLDILSASGQFTSPAAGRVRYLRTAEDYDKPVYQQMFPGGRDVYGVSAVVTDRRGKTFSVSHLADNPNSRDGLIKRGAWLGAQGNTGLTMSGQYPERKIRDGYLEDTGEFAYGAGGHGHLQFGQVQGREWQELDPQVAPVYYQAPPESLGSSGAAAPVFNLTNNITFQKVADRQAFEAQVENELDKLREQLLTLYLDGDMDRMADEQADRKRAQGLHRDPTRPQARGQK